jgi:hypothetical protein
MDALTLLLLLLGLGSDATTSDAGDPDRGQKPIGG